MNANLDIRIVQLSVQHFLLHFVLKGKGAYYLNDQKYEIKKDQCFLIRPNELTFYQADQEDPWTYIWVRFDGQMAKKYLEHAGFIDNRLVLNVHDCETLKSYVAEMLNCNKSTHANEIKISRASLSPSSKLSESVIFKQNNQAFKKIITM